jgi:hypothetical protein
VIALWERGGGQRGRCGREDGDGGGSGLYRVRWLSCHYFLLSVLFCLSPLCLLASTSLCRRLLL